MDYVLKQQTKAIRIILRLKKDNSAKEHFWQFLQFSSIIIIKLY